MFLSFAFFLLSSFFFLPSAQALVIKDQDGHVNDFANVLSDELEVQLEDDLTALATREAEPLNFTIAVLPNIDTEMVENVATAIFDHWHLAETEASPSALLVVVTQDRRTRYYANDAANKVVTESLVDQIVRTDMVPEFRKDNFEAGINKGMHNILVAIDDPEAFAPHNDAALSFFQLVLYTSLNIGGALLIIYLAAHWGSKRVPYLGTVAGVLLGIPLGMIFNAVGSASVAFGILGFAIDWWQKQK